MPATAMTGFAGVDIDAVGNATGLNVTTAPVVATGTTVLVRGGGNAIYARATTAISASTSTVNVTLSGGEYVAAATGGSRNSPATAMAIDDYAWFTT